MAFIVSVDINREFRVTCPMDRVFDLLADVPESVSHFPKVDQLVDLGDGKYRWEMKPVGPPKYNIQTVYACKYTNNREKGWVKWTPVKKEGNSLVKGKWALKDLGDDGTGIKLSTSGEMEIPLPRLIKMAVAPIVAHEFEGLVDKYIANLTKTLESKKKSKKKSKKG